MPAARRRYIDPATGDYVVENGGPRNDDTVGSQIVLAIGTRRGSCPVAIDLGSRLHEIRKARAGADRLAAAYIREAISHLIDRGEVQDPTIRVEIEGGRLDWTLAYHDRAGQRQSIASTQRITR